MKLVHLACALLLAPPAAAQPVFTACQAYANLANAQDANTLRTLYQPMQKSFIVRAIYAERLSAFHDDRADTALLNNLPGGNQELEDFANTADCGRLDRPVAHLEALAASFNSYFIDAAQAVVRRPEFMRQFLAMLVQFNATPADADLADQMCPAGVYVYLHRQAELLAALPAAHVNPKAIQHSYSDCP